MKKISAIIFLTALAPGRLPAQLPTQLPPGVALQMMVPQPAVEVATEKNQPTAEFDPPTVRVGEKTFYRVTVAATQNTIEWPGKISGPPELKFGPAVRGQISRVEGNQFHPLTSFVHEVTPMVAGRFTVPEFNVAVGGETVAVPAATLEALERDAAPSEPPRRLQLEISETNLFFGQPFRVRVLLPSAAGGQIEALREVQFNGGLMTDKLATRQSVEAVNRDGQPQPTFIYETVATPLAAGRLTLSAQAFTAGREFGGPIAISGQVTIVGGLPKYVLLTSDTVALNVRPLPERGELPGFTGAIGTFTAEPPKLSATSLRVGEPVHLKFGFSPATNLTRFVPPEMPRSREWQLVADNPPGSGCTLIPLADTVQTTPAIPFSAFNPATGKFYDLTIPGLPVTVAAEGLPVELPAWNADEKKSAPLKLSGLAPGPGKTADSLRPPQTQPGRVSAILLPVLGFLALWRWDERRRFLAAHPDIVRRRQAKRELKRERKKLETAAAAGDAEKFVAHAVAALRVAVAPHFPADARAMVGGDVLAQLEGTERHGRERDTVRQIFAVADAQFAGTRKEPAEVLAMNPDVQRVLQTLEEKL